MLELSIKQTISALSDVLFDGEARLFGTPATRRDHTANRDQAVYLCFDVGIYHQGTEVRQDIHILLHRPMNYTRAYMYVGKNPKPSDYKHVVHHDSCWRESLDYRIIDEFWPFIEQAGLEDVPANTWHQHVFVRDARKRTIRLGKSPETSRHPSILELGK